MVDDDWLHAVIAQVQVELAPLAWIEIDDVAAIVAKTIANLPTPRNHVETLLLRSLLFDGVMNGGANMHRRAHAGGTRTICPFVPAVFGEQYWRDSTSDPRTSLTAWANAFVPSFLHHHPMSPAQRAAALVRGRYREAWTATSLATGVGASRTTLTRDFEAQYGRTIHDYHRVVRVIAALEQLQATNIEAVALDVGYKSKKNLYHALQDVAGLTPASFRALTPVRAVEVIDRLRLRLARPRVSDRCEIRPGLRCKITLTGPVLEQPTRVLAEKHP